MAKNKIEVTILMRNKILIVFLVMIIAISLVSGCVKGDKDIEPTATPAPVVETAEPLSDKTIIGLSLSKESGFNNEFQKYFEAAYSETEYHVLTVYADGDYNKQVADLADMLSKNIELLVIDPTDLDNLEYILSEFEVSDIPVVNLTESVNAYTKMLIGPFYKNIGKEIGDYTFERLSDLTNDPTNVVMLRGSVDSSKMQGIYDGFLESLANTRYNTLVASPACNYDYERAKQEMAKLLKEYPKIHCVFAETTEMAIAAIDAIDEAGVKGVMITTIGGEPDGLRLVESSRIDATIIYGPNDMAKVASTYVNRILKDKLVLLPQFVELNYEIITPKSVSNYYNEDTVYALTVNSTEFPPDPEPEPDPTESSQPTEDE